MARENFYAKPAAREALAQSEPAGNALALAVQVTDNLGILPQSAKRHPPKMANRRVLARRTKAIDSALDGGTPIAEKKNTNEPSQTPIAFIDIGTIETNNIIGTITERSRIAMPLVSSARQTTQVFTIVIMWNRNDMAIALLKTTGSVRKKYTTSKTLSILVLKVFGTQRANILEKKTCARVENTNKIIALEANVIRIKKKPISGS
ncbi:MAG: hypothetical protein SV375_15455 [Thermodesulfobacteriota bacterium]|nr:hypothetical protein [Thermodesulfobacteriota bacterium]